MFGRRFSIVSLVLAALLPLSGAEAQASVSLAGDVKVVRMVEEGGEQRETLAEPEKVVPGDRLVFTTTYSNDTGQQVEDFVVTNPLPDAVMLAKTGDFEVSVDDGANFGELAAATVPNDQGGVRPAALADVTHIRWTLPRLEPGAKGKITYFAVVR